MKKLSELRQQFLFGDKKKPVPKLLLGQKKKKAIQAVVDEAPIEEHYQSELKHISEDLTQKKQELPPNMLILKRKAIRQFPNGQKIVMYYSDKIRRYISIPYDDTLIAGTGVHGISEAHKREEHAGHTFVHHPSLGLVVSDPYGIPDEMELQRAERTSEQLHKAGKDNHIVPIKAYVPKYMTRHFVRLTGLSEEIREPKKEASTKTTTRKKTSSAKPTKKKPADRVGVRKPEEKIQVGNNKELLQHAAWGKPGVTFLFKDGTKSKLGQQEAKAMLALHDNLKEQRPKFIAMIHASKENFDRVKTFALGAGLNTEHGTGTPSVKGKVNNGSNR